MIHSTTPTHRTARRSTQNCVPKVLRGHAREPDLPRRSRHVKRHAADRDPLLWDRRHAEPSPFRADGDRKRVPSCFHGDSEGVLCWGRARMKRGRGGFVFQFRKSVCVVF